MNIKLLSITFSILFIVSCGGGGGGGGGGVSPTTPSTPAPTVNLSAEPTSVLLESTSTLSWSSTNASSCSASWTTQTSTSGSRTVTITTAGNNSFSMTCSGDGGSRSASVTVEGYRNIEGVVVDGYISGAEVFIDEDDDWALDSNENSTTSDNNGKFSIKYTNGNLVSFSGTDLDSQILLDNLLFTHKLTGHTDFKAVTPVTSIAAFMEDSSAVNVALGIDSSIDVFTFDPVANKGDGGINDYLYEKGNQLTVLAFALQNITNNLNTTTEITFSNGDFPLDSIQALTTKFKGVCNIGFAFCSQADGGFKDVILTKPEDDFYSILRIEPKESQSDFSNYELSSIIDVPDNNLINKVSEDSNVLEYDFINDVFVATGLIDTTKIEKGQQYDLSAEIRPRNLEE